MTFRHNRLSLNSESAYKLTNRIPGLRLLISSLPGSALRMNVKSLDKPRDSTSFFKVLPSNLRDMHTRWRYLVTHQCKELSPCVL